MEEIIKEEPITMSELKFELDNIKKKDKELNFRSNKTLDFLNKFTIIEKSKTDELKKKLADLKIPRFKEEHIVKIIDMMPESTANLKVILQGFSISVTNENLNKIAGVLKEYLPK